MRQQTDREVISLVLTPASLMVAGMLCAWRTSLPCVVACHHLLVLLSAHAYRQRNVGCGCCGRPVTIPRRRIQLGGYVPLYLEQSNARTPAWRSRQDVIARRQDVGTWRGPSHPSSRVCVSQADGRSPQMQSPGDGSTPASSRHRLTPAAGTGAARRRLVSCAVGAKPSECGCMHGQSYCLELQLAGTQLSWHRNTQPDAELSSV